MLKAFKSNQIEQRSYPQVFAHNFYIYGEVSEDTNDYIELIHTLDTAEESDVINIYINTPGGSLETTISIVHAMYRTKGAIVTHADGQVASAGTLIFFAGHTYCVYPYSHMMLHDGGSYMGGKFNENLKNAQATVALVTKICYDLYQPTFTKEEVDSILSGVDKYCSSEELTDRLNKSETCDGTNSELENVKLSDELINDIPNLRSTDTTIEVGDEVIIVDGTDKDVHGTIGTVIEVNLNGTYYAIETENFGVLDYKREQLIPVKKLNTIKGNDNVIS